MQIVPFFFFWSKLSSEYLRIFMGHFLHCEIFFCRSFRPWNLTNFARSLRAERGEVNQAWGESSLIGEFQLFHWSPFHACHNLIHSLVLIKAQSFTIYKVCMFFLEHGFTINVLGWRSYPGNTTEGTFKTEYITSWHMTSWPMTSWHMTFLVKTKVFPLFQTSKKDARGDKISPGHLSPRASFHPGICLTRASFHPGKFTLITWHPDKRHPGTRRCTNNKTQDKRWKRREKHFGFFHSL